MVVEGVFDVGASPLAREKDSRSAGSGWGGSLKIQRDATSISGNHEWTTQNLGSTPRLPVLNFGNSDFSLLGSHLREESTLFTSVRENNINYVG